MKTALISLIILSACQTFAFADYNTGLAAYRKGDYQTAISEFKSSAENGDQRAQFGLGRIYEDGKGVPQDYELAIKWYRQAAAQGHAGAQSHLGNMYAKGFGTKPDAEEAVKWHCHAAEQGYAKSQYDLGIMFSRGKTIEQNQIRAHMWLNLAAAKKYFGASMMRQGVERSMTQEQVTEAQKLAREWKPKILIHDLEQSCKEVAHAFQDKTEKERKAHLQEIRERRERAERWRQEFESRVKKGGNNGGNVRTELEQYYGLLGERVRSFWTVPLNLVNLQKLSVSIAVDVARDGKIRNLKIEGSSGNSKYDEAALTAVRRASSPSFPPVPNSVKEDWLKLGFRFCGGSFC